MNDPNNQAVPAGSNLREPTGKQLRARAKQVTALIAGTVLAGCLTSCGFLVANPTSGEDWEEVLDFDIQPGTMNPAEAEAAINDQIAPDRIVPGSASHRGSVVAPGGLVDFFSYRMVDPDLGAQPVFCTSVVADFSMSAGCGNGPPAQPVEPLQLNGESLGGSWRSAEFLVQDDVTRVEATASDGTVYTITPSNGFGYVEWPDERGSLELVAFNAGDAELGRAFAGMDR